MSAEVWSRIKLPELFGNYEQLFGHEEYWFELYKIGHLINNKTGNRHFVWLADLGYYAILLASVKRKLETEKDTHYRPIENPFHALNFITLYPTWSSISIEQKLDFPKEYLENKYELVDHILRLKESIN